MPTPELIRELRHNARSTTDLRDCDVPGAFKVNRCKGRLQNGHDVLFQSQGTFLNLNGGCSACRGGPARDARRSRLGLGRNGAGRETTMNAASHLRQDTDGGLRQ
jgi:hypothetical protein